jgi:streptomycin 6-kinase
VKAAAIVLWVLAWACAGLIPAAWFAARDGKRGAARAELAIGVGGAGGLAWAGAALW